MTRSEIEADVDATIRYWRGRDPATGQQRVLRSCAWDALNRRRSQFDATWAQIREFMIRWEMARIPRAHRIAAAEDAADEMQLALSARLGA